MIRRTFFARWARPALLFALLPLGGLALYSPLSMCEVAEEWAVQRDARGISYAEVAALPTEFQRALLEQLPDSDRVRLWDDHLASFLSEPSELTLSQLRTRALLHEELTSSQMELLREVRADLPRLTSNSVPVGHRFLAFARYRARANRLFENSVDFDRITARIGIELSVAERDEVIAELQSEVMHPGEARLRSVSWRVSSSLTRRAACNCASLFNCDGNALCWQTVPPCTEGPCGGTIGGGWCSAGRCVRQD
jgi:hypothetical protein